MAAQRAAQKIDEAGERENGEKTEHGEACVSRFDAIIAKEIEAGHRARCLVAAGEGGCATRPRGPVANRSRRRVRSVPSAIGPVEAGLSKRAGRSGHSRRAGRGGPAAPSLSVRAGRSGYAHTMAGCETRPLSAPGEMLAFTPITPEAPGMWSSTRGTEARRRIRAILSGRALILTVFGCVLLLNWSAALWLIHYAYRQRGDGGAADGR